MDVVESVKKQLLPLALRPIQRIVRNNLFVNLDFETWVHPPDPYELTQKGEWSVGLLLHKVD